MGSIEMAPATEMVPVVEATRPQAERRGVMTRVRRAVAGVALAGAGLLAPYLVSSEAADAAPAQGLGCYGDYCSGLYADQTGCDQDARTVTSAPIIKTDGTLSVDIGPVSGSTGSGSQEIGVIEVRASETCGTAWARVRTNEANDITYVGIQKDDGYAMQRDIDGAMLGSPAGNAFTPMIYDRSGAEFRAYVFSQEWYDVTPDNNGTYFVTP